MELILARLIKLNPTQEQSTALFSTLSQYKIALDTPLKYGFEHKITNSVNLHKATYYTLRNSTDLPSQLICSARCKAASTLKSIKTKTEGNFDTKLPKSHSYTTIRYDINSCSLKENSVKLLTLNGRIEIPLTPNPLLKNEKHLLQDTIELIYKKQKKQWYIIVFIKPEIKPKQQENKVLGIDRGCNNIAVLSNNTFFNSKHLKNVKHKYNYLRKHLKNKGTKSAKKLLRKISGKENRFVKDTNHCISKYIVNLPYNIFVLEDLNIKTKKENGKRFNKILGNWSWNQLEQFIGYKAELLGKTSEFVEAAYTSQRCSCCGHTERANRHGNSFCCKKCGFKLHADLNASRNIAFRSKFFFKQVVINQPNVSTEILVRDKPPPLWRG